MADAGNGLKSRLDVGSVRFTANHAALLQMMAVMREQEQVIRLSGGEKAAAAQRAKGRMTARERIGLLVDCMGDVGGASDASAPPGDTGLQDGLGAFLELGLWGAFEMYAEHGGAPGAGVVTGLGRVSERLCMIVANDATVKAGAFFPMTAKKVLRAQTIALENRIPTIYLVDSAGVFLPLQDEVFPDTDDFGRVFRNNAVMSSLGVPQMTAIMGMCVAGGAYLPVMTDTVLMTEGSGLFLAGPALVQAAIGQVTSAEELGGAAMHAEISGTVDFREKDDASCLRRMRTLVGMMGKGRQGAGIRDQGSEDEGSGRRSDGSVAEVFSRVAFDAEADGPRWDAEELLGLMDPSPGASNAYDVREVIARVTDRSEFEEYRADFGRTLVCGYARIGGRAVGIVANQKMNQTMTVSTGPAAGTKRTEFGGVIYTEGAQKAARFVMDCNQSLIPLLFLHDVNGFMVGKDAEWSGIIRAGAKMVSAVACSVVPKITVILGGSFGAGHYAMCGKAYDPRFIFAWPTARYAVMSGASAASTLAGIRTSQMERGGRVLSAEEKKALYDEIKASYDAQADVRYGAARLWVDAIIDPRDTREVLLWALEAASLNTETGRFGVGVMQT